MRLWPTNIGDGVEELLRARFPKLIVVKAPEEIKTAFAECDFFLHGSGSGFVAQKHLAQWVAETGKPYGIYAISLTSPPGDESRRLIDGARFTYFRDGHSLAWAKTGRAGLPDHGIRAGWGVRRGFAQ
ncbi:MAG: hypothetical protein WDN28_26740 [Chthoniobacter sp.]